MRLRMEEADGFDGGRAESLVVNLLLKPAYGSEERGDLVFHGVELGLQADVFGAEGGEGAALGGDAIAVRFEDDFYFVAIQADGDVDQAVDVVVGLRPCATEDAADMFELQLGGGDGDGGAIFAAGGDDVIAGLRGAAHDDRQLSHESHGDKLILVGFQRDIAHDHRSMRDGHDVFRTVGFQADLSAVNADDLSQLEPIFWIEFRQPFGVVRAFGAVSDTFVHADFRNCFLDGFGGNVDGIERDVVMNAILIGPAIKVIYFLKGWDVKGE